MIMQPLVGGAMHITGNFFIEIAGLAVIFGPLPLSFFTYHAEPHISLGFLLGYVFAFVLFGYIQTMLVFLLIPWAWYVVLRPVIKRSP
jgi:hypothetical protein